MSEKNLVQKSLIRFLKENITDVFITENSSFSNMENFGILYSKQNLEPSNTSDTLLTGTLNNISGFTVTGDGTSFLSELTEGDTVKINDTLGIVQTIFDDTSFDLKEEFTQTWTLGDDIYIASGKEFQVIDEAQNDFKTDFDLTGWSITADGESNTIVNYDLNKSQILLQNNFSETVLGWDEGVGTELSIELDKWIYVKNPYSLPSIGSIHNLEHSDKYVLFIKTKNDSNKEKINDILQNIRNTLFGNNLKFPIYDEDEITILAYARMRKNDFEENELYDNDQNLQSFRFDMIVKYFINYNK